MLTKGEQNSRRWVLDFEADQTTMFNLGLVDWRSGKLCPKGMLVASMTPQNAVAARSAVFFPVLEGPYFTVAVELPAQSDGPALFRVTVDAPHTLLR